MIQVQIVGQVKHAAGAAHKMMMTFLLDNSSSSSVCLCARIGQHGDTHKRGHARKSRRML